MAGVVPTAMGLARTVYFGCKALCVLLAAKFTPPKKDPTAAQAKFIRLLANHVACFLSLEEGVVPLRDWGAFSKSKSLTSSGAVVAVARVVSWAQVEPALPPPEHCEAFDAVWLSKGAVRLYLLDLMVALVPNVLAGPRPKVPRCQTRSVQKLAVARGLLARRLAIPLRWDELLFVGGEPLLNRWWGV